MEKIRDFCLNKQVTSLDFSLTWKTAQNQTGDQNYEPESLNHWEIPKTCTSL